MKYTYENILVARDEVTHVSETYLRERGWRFVCDTPGSIWLWEKKIGERTALCDTNSAIYMQRSIDE